MVEYVMHMSPGWLILGMIVGFIGLVSQIALYAKAGQPWISALVPVWNVVVFIKLVGRPVWHSIWLIGPGTIFMIVFFVFFKEIDGLFPIPPGEDDDGIWKDGPSTFDHMIIPLSICFAALVPMAVFIAKVFTEVCDSFGKHTRRDKILCITLNGIYILFVIGISDAIYEAPWYAKKNNIPYVMPEIKGGSKKKAASESAYVHAMTERFKTDKAKKSEKKEEVHSEKKVDKKPDKKPDSKSDSKTDDDKKGYLALMAEKYKKKK